MMDDVDTRATQLAEAVRMAKDIGERGGSPLGKTRDSPMMQATTAPTDVAFGVFEKLLAADGLRYALYSILRLTDYRFISVFRFEDGMIRSVAHVDREDLLVLETDASAESASYCCYVRTEDGPFAVVDSTLDSRVEGHDKQQVLRAYCGIPLSSPDGVLLGTLCHYDTVPRDPAQLNTELLAKVASMIAQMDLSQEVSQSSPAGPGLDNE